MKLLNFSSDSPNYRVVDGDMIWDGLVWKLGESYEKFALSSCFIAFEKVASYKPIIISCSLVDEDYTNWNGIIGAGAARAKTVSLNPANLEFWNIDSARPRNVKIAIKGVDAQNVIQINIVLAFC